jgi:hypothetical protein
MKPRRIGPDFHLVELTPGGIAFAKGEPLRIANGRISVLFSASGEPVKVARYEWDMLLRDHSTVCGRKLFQVVPEPEPSGYISVIFEPEVDETKESA